METYLKKKGKRSQIYKDSRIGQGKLQDGEAALFGPACEQNRRALTKQKECLGRSSVFLLWLFALCALSSICLLAISAFFLYYS